MGDCIACCRSVSCQCWIEISFGGDGNFQGVLVMSDETLFGDKTSADWKAALDGGNPTEILFDDFLMPRLNARYFSPVEKLNVHPDRNNGEGFLIVSALCAAIEFLGALRQGTTYAPKLANAPGWEGKGFVADSRSNAYFSLILGHGVFSGQFGAYMDDFCSNVRCSLLHDARTTNNWRIRNDLTSASDALIVDGDVKRINRTALLSLICDYLRAYRLELIKDMDLREKFIQKMNAICESIDTARR